MLSSSLVLFMFLFNACSHVFCSTRVGWKVHRLMKKELCHSNETWDALNWTFPDTNCIVSFQINLHMISNSRLETFQNGLGKWRRVSCFTRTMLLHSDLPFWLWLHQSVASDDELMIPEMYNFTENYSDLNSLHHPLSMKLDYMYVQISQVPNTRANQISIKSTCACTRSRVHATWWACSLISSFKDVAATSIFKPVKICLVNVHANTWTFTISAYVQHCIFAIQKLCDYNFWGLICKYS